MGEINVAIADDNERILDLLGEIISSDKELNLVGKANNGEDVYHLIQNRATGMTPVCGFFKMKHTEACTARDFEGGRNNMANQTIRIKLKAYSFYCGTGWRATIPFLICYENGMTNMTL